MKTVIEPYRNKTVEPIKFTTFEERQRLLKEVGYNLFQLRAEHVIVDLLTDSGTSAMSSEQWSAMMRGDESYAGCSSFYRFQDAVKGIFGLPEVLPVHQGRAAERLLFSRLVKPGHIVPSNSHFDTTRANIECLGAQALDLLCLEAADSASDSAFKGNIDLSQVEKLLAKHDRDKIPFGMITISNNAAGGQPVSLQNIREYSALLKRYGIPFYIDGARFAENAYMIKDREIGQGERNVRDIVSEIFSLADGTLVSAKKDGLVNMGGFIALRDKPLADLLKQDLILTEGFPTYGGLNGRDLEAMAVGLQEVLCENYLLYRKQSAAYLARGLCEQGVPIVQPPGMHAIYVNATKMLPHIPAQEYPGQALVCALYLEAGVRSCEIGAVMFGKAQAGTPELARKPDLVRLALPRRLYNQSHYDYVIEAAGNVRKQGEKIRGVRIVWEAPALRHFTAVFEPVNASLTSAPVHACKEIEKSSLSSI